MEKSKKFASSAPYSSRFRLCEELFSAEDVSEDLFRGHLPRFS
jgi:hypothetical protein